MAKFDEEQLAQLRAIQKGERFYTEQLIKKHTKPILDKVSRIEKVQQEDRTSSREDVDAVVTEQIKLEKRVTRLEKAHALEPVASI